MSKVKSRCVVCQDGFTIKHLADRKVENLLQLDFPVCKKHILEVCQYLEAKAKIIRHDSPKL